MSFQHFAVVTIVALAACSDPTPSQDGSAPNAGGATVALYPWPFTVDEVTIRCRNPTSAGTGMVTVTTAEGREYGINGLAHRDYPEFDAIWRDDPEIAGMKVNIGAVIDRGLDLCLGSGNAAPPFRATAGSPPAAATTSPSPAAEALPAIDQSALELRIASAEEVDGAVTGQIETNMPLPIEIMVGVSLRGQHDDDIYIGNSLRVRVTSSPQAFRVPTNIRGGLPSGPYDVEATFYPRWGADNGPAEARAITREISATRRLTLRGNQMSVGDAQARNEARRWLMESTASGDRWDPREFDRRMGPSERFAVPGHNNLFVGFYFPRADATVFVNTLRNEIVVWRLGRQADL